MYKFCYSKMMKAKELCQRDDYPAVYTQRPSKSFLLLKLFIAAGVKQHSLHPVALLPDWQYRMIR